MNMLRKIAFKPPTRKNNSGENLVSPSNNNKSPNIPEEIIHNETLKSTNAVTSESQSESPICGSEKLITVLAQNMKSPETAVCDAVEPEECAYIRNSKEKKLKLRRLKDKPVKCTADSDSLSTYCSEEFSKQAISSTPQYSETIESKFPRKSNKSPGAHKKGAEEGLRNKPVTFREALKLLEASQSFEHHSDITSIIMEPLSQPPSVLNHRDRLLWLQERRGTDLWVECDQCQKWRQLDIQDPVDVPKIWTCNMNPDPKMAKCTVPETEIPISIEMDIIYNKYTAGSVVWAKVQGHPYWPAMVDDCPDTEQYYWLNEHSDIPTDYHVTFFDSEEVTRAWIPVKRLKTFKDYPNYDRKTLISARFAARIQFAKKQADDALKLDIQARLKKYSFLTRWPHKIGTPLSTRDILEKAEENSKRKRAAKKESGSVSETESKNARKKVSGSKNLRNTRNRTTGKSSKEN